MSTEQNSRQHEAAQINAYVRRRLAINLKEDAKALEIRMTAKAALESSSGLDADLITIQASRAAARAAHRAAGRAVHWV